MSIILAIFLIGFLGYMIGGIKVWSIELGTAGVLLVALIFGHYGIVVPDIVREMGLVFFVTSVGFVAGPNFFRNFKQNAASYVLIGILMIISGAASCALIIKLSGISPALAGGLLTGALTSTPGLAAAVEAAGENGYLASIGYGIAYPFGVVSVVLFVQLIPKILKADMDKEREVLVMAANNKTKLTLDNLYSFDSAGFFAICLAAVLGFLLGKITVPLPGGSKFSLGNSGGPLIIGLILGHFGHIGKINISVKKPVLETLRELGLMLFLIGAGTKAGQGFVEVLMQYGLMLFVYGAIMAIIPMIVGYYLAEKMLKLSLLNNLGAITGGMTSTPALGALIEAAKTDDVASSYAATYPVALVAVVLSSQFLIILFG
ncbi:MAG TPA: permease [Sedimentibacter sp.]|nr:permease [Sedimentibacter sp.]HRC81710.1 permease [Sedimentibacter sp.]